MQKTIVTINLSEIIEDTKFRNAINALGTYQSEDEYLNAMIAITKRDMENDPNFPT